VRPAEVQEAANDRSLQFLLDSLNQTLPRRAGRPVRLLLDTDREVGKELGSPEWRVGLAPDQVRDLIRSAAHLGIHLQVAVVAGAGELAGYPDGEYEAAGAEISQLDRLSSSECFDIVTALKEPTAHEALIPGPFVRIGALHLTDHTFEGPRALLKAGNFSLLLDGASIGKASYVLSGGYPTPVVATMSPFAGRRAADLAIDAFAARRKGQPGRVVIVGGGVVGTTAAYHLRGRCRQVVVLDVDLDRVSELRQEFMGILDGTAYVVLENTVHSLEEALDGAEALILAARRGVEKAPKVVNLHQLDFLAPGAVVIDIGIDQGGSIRNPDIVTGDDQATIIARNKGSLEIARGLRYVAEPNMPRTYPREASQAHGRAIAPYLLALGVLCAREGSPRAAAEAILGATPSSASGSAHDYFKLVLQDLRNGSDLAVDGDVLVVCNEDLLASPELMSLLTQTWGRGGVRDHLGARGETIVPPTWGTLASAPG
jgi:alanine dehydrogenase